jgi:superfamily II DNA or RNA helicase
VFAVPQLIRHPEGGVMLRDYKAEMIDEFDRLATEVTRSVLMDAPIGSGKMIMAAAIVPSAVVAGQRVA